MMKRTIIAANLVFTLCPSASNAAYVFDITEVGGNVVVLGGGSINLAGFLLDSSNTLMAGLYPSSPAAAVGGDAFGDIYKGAITPASAFGPGGFNVPDFSSGPLVGFVISQTDTLFVLNQYISNATLGASTSTYVGATFASLGLTQGSYVYVLNPGRNDDTITVNVGTVPLPAGAPLFGFALLGLGAYGGLVKRKIAQAA